MKINMLRYQYMNPTYNEQPSPDGDWLPQSVNDLHAQMSAEENEKQGRNIMATMLSILK